MSNEIKIELLWNCAKALNSEQQTHQLLRSYYINTCRKLAKSNLQVPKEKFALSQMCSYCGSFWNESEFELKSISKKLSLSSKEKRLIENYQKGNGSVKTLSRAEKNRAKWLIKKQFKSLVIKCHLCKHKSFVHLENERSKLKTHPREEVSDGIAQTISYEYIQHKSKQDDGNRVPYKQTHFVKKTKPDKEKTLICKNKMKANRTFSNKVVSNTQKKNSLLQLAALLKREATVDTKRSSQNKLQYLLK